jgi:hypothetical protein
MWGVVVCDPRTSRPWPALDRSDTKKKVMYQHDLRKSGCGLYKFSYSQMSNCKTTKTCPDLELKPLPNLEVKKLPLRKRSY